MPAAGTPFGWVPLFNRMWIRKIATTLPSETNLFRFVLHAKVYQKNFGALNLVCRVERRCRMIYMFVNDSGCEDFWLDPGFRVLGPIDLEMLSVKPLKREDFWLGPGFRVFNALSKMQPRGVPLFDRMWKGIIATTLHLVQT